MFTTLRHDTNGAPDEHGAQDLSYLYMKGRVVKTSNCPITGIQVPQLPQRTLQLA